jgi:hypothetical protein
MSRDTDVLEHAFRERHERREDREERREDREDRREERRGERFDDPLRPRERFIQHPRWQGPDLALEQLEYYFHVIRKSLQPPRADIIDNAARQGLEVVELLEQWEDSLPPGFEGETHGGRR